MAAKAEKGDPSKSWLDRPMLDFIEQYFYIAWERLRSSAGEHPISITEMRSYYEWIGAIGPVEEFVAVIQACDRAFMTWRKSQASSSV